MSAPRPLSGPRRTARVQSSELRRRASTRQRRKHRLTSLLRRIRRRLGIPQIIEVGGVRYAERDPVPLGRAISPRGPGVKEYAVRFPAGGRMRIRCTTSRLYTDLVNDPAIAAYQPGLARIRPGMRVLEFGSGTGATAGLLAHAVGPSGGVISLGSDRESIRFARQRYPANHLAVELGGVETLRGELDGAFDAALIRDIDRLDENGIREIWRCVAPGGWLLAIESKSTQRQIPTDLLVGISASLQPQRGVMVYERDPETTRRPSPPSSDRPSLDQ